MAVCVGEEEGAEDVATDAEGAVPDPGKGGEPGEGGEPEADDVDVEPGLWKERTRDSQRENEAGGGGGALHPESRKGKRTNGFRWRRGRWKRGKLGRWKSG